MLRHCKFFIHTSLPRVSRTTLLRFCTDNLQPRPKEYKHLHMYVPHGVAVVYKQCSMIVKSGKKFAHVDCKIEYRSISNTVVIPKKIIDRNQRFKH